jgi:hypothetical protein
MRLWSIHPSYLDPKGLVALWREALLAQQVLLGNTKGYRHHPQLIRFRYTPDPAGTIARYLAGVVAEADRRGYCFDRGKIVSPPSAERIPVTTGQLAYEMRHLLSKLERRNPDFFIRAQSEKEIRVHPLFTSVHGRVESWEAVQREEFRRS